MALQKEITNFGTAYDGYHKIYTLEACESGNGEKYEIVLSVSVYTDSTKDHFVISKQYNLGVMDFDMSPYYERLKTLDDFSGATNV